MFFDTHTTASKPGRTSGVCTLLENAVDETCCGWRVGTKCKFFYRRICLACVSAHKLDQRLYSSADCGRARIGSIIYLVQQEQPILIPASESVKTCILQHCQKVYPKDDHRDFVNLVALMVGFEINVMHRARRIARFIYSMKTAVLRATKQLTAHELHGVQRISRFVVCIGLYL